MNDKLEDIFLKRESFMKLIQNKFQDSYPDNWPVNISEKASQNILRETRNNKKLKFIFISTASIYQTSKKIVNENSKLEILSYYNLHKFYCENLIKLFSNFSKNILNKFV